MFSKSRAELISSTKLVNAFSNYNAKYTLTLSTVKIIGKYAVQTNYTLIFIKNWYYKNNFASNSYIFFKWYNY